MINSDSTCFKHPVGGAGFRNHPPSPTVVCLAVLLTVFFVFIAWNLWFMLSGCEDENHWILLRQNSPFTLKVPKCLPRWTPGIRGLSRLGRFSGAAVLRPECRDAEATRGRRHSQSDFPHTNQRITWRIIQLRIILVIVSLLSGLAYPTVSNTFFRGWTTNPRAPPLGPETWSVGWSSNLHERDQFLHAAHQKGPRVLGSFEG